MTLSDFLAASQGDERLAWARFLMWNGGKTNTNFPGQATPEWAEFCSTVTESLLGVADFTDDDDGTDYLAQADAVLAELARQREADKARIEQLEKDLEDCNRDLWNEVERKGRYNNQNA